MKPLVWLAGTLAAAVSIASEPPAQSPFAFFEPSVRVSAPERARLDKGEVIARVLPADDGHLAFFAAAPFSARPDALLEWTRAIDQLKRGPLVLGVGRFSDEITDRDLDELTVEKTELDALKRCRVGSCDLKLAASEISGIQHALRAAGAAWRQAAEREFRMILTARVRLHRDRGLLALPPNAGDGGRISVGEAFSAIAARSPHLMHSHPEVINSLLMPSRSAVTGDEAFYYWSRERYGAGKSVVTITYVRLVRSERAPQALTISTVLYASHYIDGALGVSAVVCDAAVTSCYLAYLNRTHVDLLGGLFGRLKRAVLEGRVESDGPALMRDVTRRLEGGAPAARGSEGGES
jgi:hypothetical protein